MQGHDIIAIGASAGGVEALMQLVQGLPEDLPAAVFVVLHVSPESPGYLPGIFDRIGKLRAVSPRDKAKVEHGCIYLAPPDRHMLLENDRVRVLRGPKENRHRPAIDPLFRSAAWSHGPRVVGVVLTGMLDDGTAGLWSIKTCGGVCVVQDPEDAVYPSMPTSAIRNVDVDYCLPLDRISRLLADLARKPVTDFSRDVPDKLKVETEAAVLGKNIDDMRLLGQPSPFSCPSCRGTLWELRDGEILRYRCHVGHAFMPQSLHAEQGDAVEEALYAALSAMEEKIVLLRRIASQMSLRYPKEASLYEDKASQQEAYAAQIRALLGGKETR